MRVPLCIESDLLSGCLVGFVPGPASVGEERESGPLEKERFAYGDFSIGLNGAAVNDVLVLFLH